MRLQKMIQNAPQKKDMVSLAAAIGFAKREDFIHWLQAIVKVLWLSLYESGYDFIHSSVFLSSVSGTNHKKPKELIAQMKTEIYQEQNRFRFFNCIFSARVFF